jgi:xylulokinase
MFLGIDLGTSDVKALLLDDTHRVQGVAHSPLTVQRLHPLWSEQEPDDWWQAVAAVVEQLRLTHPKAWRGIRGIGLSGQMHGAVLLGDQQQVLRPAILWNDGRSSAQCDALSQRVPHLTSITGNLAMPGFTAPKLLWVQANEPEVFKRTERVLLPKDFLRLRMTGQAVSEMSDASGTLWLDVALRRWSPELLGTCGLTIHHMPRLVEGSDPSAVLSPDVAARWGLRDDVVVAGGAGDNAASAVGMGCIDPGQGFVSLGTSGVVFVSGDHFAPNPAQALHAFCHALPKRWHQMSVMLSAASSLTWAAGVWGWPSESALLSDAASTSATQRAHAPRFMPYLSGERTPLNRADAMATLQGLTHAHGRPDVAYAIVEGVTLGLLDGWRSFGDISAVRTLSAVGGGSRSSWWLQLLSSALNLPLTQHASGDAGGALGAARLAWLACGGSTHDVCLPTDVSLHVMPHAQEHAALQTRYEAFQKSQAACLPS